MSHFTGESWLEAQAEYSVPGDAHDQLAERPKPSRTNICDAVDWGLTNCLPLAYQLKAAMYTGSEWGISGPVMIRGGKNLTIRTAPSAETAEVYKVLNDDIEVIANRAARRSNYDPSVTSANEIMHIKKQDNAESTFLNSVKGSVYLLPGTWFINEAIKQYGYTGYEPSPLAVATVWVVGSVIHGIARAKSISEDRDEKIKNAKACDLPPDVETTWQQLVPLLEQVVKDYTIESQPGDVSILSEMYSIDVKKLEKKLRKSGGSKPAEYSGLLNELKENKKYHKGKKPELFINPEHIVRNALLKTDGKVWGTDFSHATEQIAAAQSDREALTQQLSKLEKELCGVDRSIEQAFRTRIARCEDTIALATLDIFKIHAAYIDEQHRLLIAQAPAVDDPFMNVNSLEPKGFPEGSDEIQVDTNWPLLGPKLGKEQA